MNTALRAFLFEKAILVSDAPGEHPVATLVALAKSFHIKITSGCEHACESLIPFVAEMLGQRVPEPFYRNFPDSVRKMRIDQLLFDQLLHYTATYGFGMTDEAGHSIFERDFERLAFTGEALPREFSILTEAEALDTLSGIMDDMLLGSRPLSADAYEALLAMIREHGYTVKSCTSKDTLIRLLVDTRDLRYAETLWLSDVIKLLDRIQFSLYNSKDLKKLNLKNRDRVLLTAVIDLMFRLERCNVRDCFEKKKIFAGLLHHIHYKPKTEEAASFLRLMRGNENRSAYSEFEAAMARGDIPHAVSVLARRKGTGAVLRNLNYLASRAESKEDLSSITDAIGPENPVVMIQLLLQYASYVKQGARTFTFKQHGMLAVHTETEEEVARRKSRLTKKTAGALASAIRKKLKEVLKGRLGKVYIDPDMYRIAIPLDEAVSFGGFGTLPAGSCLPMEKGRILRAFTYWEEVDDIDLSLIGLTKRGRAEEFSWRTMYMRQSDAIAFSGDETSGYNGGSEYYDINLEAFKREYPDISYLVFCNNVYSYSTFADCFCRAGYMIRKEGDGGEIYEPKTVKSAFTVSCPSSSAYLFGINLQTDEFVWLNIGRDALRHVAAHEKLDFLLPYFSLTKTLSLGDLFKLLSTRVVTDPKEADVALTDADIPLGEHTKRITCHDTEAILALLG